MPRSKKKNSKKKNAGGFVKCSILLEGLDKELELGKVVAIKSDQISVLYLEQMRNGKWRLTYSTNLIPDIKQLQGLKIIRKSEIE